MSRPEPIEPPPSGEVPRPLREVPATPPVPAAPSEGVDWGAVLRGCPCRTCSAARRAVYGSDPAPPRRAGSSEAPSRPDVDDGSEPPAQQEVDPGSEPPAPQEADGGSEAPPPPEARAPGEAPAGYTVPPAPHRPPEFVDPWSDAPPRRPSTPRSPEGESPAARPPDGGPAAARPPDRGDPAGPRGSTDRGERTLRALLDERLGPLERKVDALLDAARRERGPLSTAARAVARFADEVDRLVSGFDDPGRPPRR